MKIFNKKNEIIVKNNEIRTVEVRDLKEYLVKDFEQIKEYEQLIDTLNERIEELNKIKIKYDATLITLEEFDARVLREKDKNIRLEQQLTKKNEEIAKLNEEKNNCLIREKIANDKIENSKDFIISEFKEQLKSKVTKTKGVVSKQKIISIIEEAF